MTHPPQPTGSPAPRTQEIPVVAPPPAPTPTHDPAFVPGFADPQPAAHPFAAEAASRPRRPHSPRRRAVALGAALVMLALLLLTWGLSVGEEPLWSTSTLWSVFAFACTAGLLLGLVPDPRGRQIALGGLAGLAVFWLVVALPHAASNRGFLLTAALAAAVAAVWTAPDRPAAGPR